MSSSSRAIDGKRTMILLRSVAGTLLALSLAGPATGQEGGTDGQRFAGELMRHLGLDPARRLIELENGAVVHNGVPSQEKLADEVAAAGSMLLVRGREASAVIDAFLHTETFLQVHKVKRQQAVEPNAGDGPAFAGLPFPGSESVAELVKAPRRSLNLSVAEGERLSRLDLAAPDLAGRARAAFAKSWPRDCAAMPRAASPASRPTCARAGRSSSRGSSCVPRSQAWPSFSASSRAFSTGSAPVEAMSPTTGWSAASSA